MEAGRQALQTRYIKATKHEQINKHNTTYTHIKLKQK
jgi:hypothetical protein